MQKLETQKIQLPTKNSVKQLTYNSHNNNSVNHTPVKKTGKNSDVLNYTIKPHFPVNSANIENLKKSNFKLSAIENAKSSYNPKLNSKKTKKPESVFYLFLLLIFLIFAIFFLFGSSENLNKLIHIKINDDIVTKSVMEEEAIKLLKDKNIPTVKLNDDDSISISTLKANKIENPSEQREAFTKEKIIQPDNETVILKPQAPNVEKVENKAIASQTKDFNKTNSNTKEQNSNNLSETVEKEKQQEIVSIKPNPKLTYLKRENGKINIVSKPLDVPQGEDYIRYVLDALIQSKDLKNGEINLIPQSTQVNNVIITGNILNVDLSSSFIDENTYGTQGINLSIKQIVYSLTEINKDYKIKLSIDGKNQDVVYEGVSFKNPFDRNSSF